MPNDAFPTLTIRADSLQASGAFAQTQAQYLQPDAALVVELDAWLKRTNTGVVAHFYMDAELQGVLSACTWPHVFIADSLQMAGKAVQMAQDGVKRIVVLGVDFMSENARAMLDASGFQDLPVYRVAAEEIGCSLAQAAESPAYDQYLANAARAAHPLHVIYVNTSLLTKAKAQATLPTITCTSSNVVRLILQAAAQLPEVQIFFGPDTYMGANLKRYFQELSKQSPEQIRAVHPQHNAQTLSALLESYDYFKDGTCIVHHMFNREIVDKLNRNYPDAMVAAHLEVPGDMFAIGLHAQAHGRGVVGSTSQILGFIEKKVDEQIANDNGRAVRVALGTESGMVTSIVNAVQKKLRAAPHSNQTPKVVEIIFPVADEAISVTQDPALPVVPGVVSGDGCSIAGGCATCPYMKMNSLAALFKLLKTVEKAGDTETHTLREFFPRSYQQTFAGQPIAELGREPILAMRHFQERSELSTELVKSIRSFKTPKKTQL